MADLKEFAEQLVNLSVKEVSELANILKDEYGIEPTAAAPVMVAGASGDDEAGSEEKTSFDVVLTEVGGQKIQVIKEIRSLTELSLKEAKELTDNAPKPIKTGVPKDEAEKIQKAIEKAGGKAEIK